MADRGAEVVNPSQGVHFEEPPRAQPSSNLKSTETQSGLLRNNRDELNSMSQHDLQQLRNTLHNNIHVSRMQNHAFEAISLPGSAPVSRVGSGTSTPQRRYIDESREQSPPSSTVHSPPLTPAGTLSREGAKPPHVAVNAIRPPDVVTPQRSKSPGHGEVSGPVSSHPKHQPAFTLGPSGDSQPPSKDISPSATPISTAPGTPQPSSMPTRDAAKPKEQPETTESAESNDARFRFGNRDPAVGYANSGFAAATVPPIPTISKTLATGSHKPHEDKRSSLFGGARRHDDDHISPLSEKSHHHSSSKSNLKRFFKFVDHKHRDRRDEKEKEKDPAKAPGAVKEVAASPASAAMTAPQASVPFADDHGLQSKYGKFGRILGSGAGGSVRLMKRSGDGVVFAVKQFRDRHTYESERDYNKKVTAEFCIGSTLHHGNVIETIDIVHEKGKWFEVMEYAPYDLFATVMTGKMGKEEITCATLQILSGVLYLHSMGMAHRDLKLDNVVISEHGIMKLIDFGSAVVFKYPFENDIVLATGVVGSDPYLAPEVYDQARYDPRCADIWSIAIMFCCMTLRRFPWKAPRTSDNSYRLFVATPDPDQDRLLEASRRSNNGRTTRSPAGSTPASRQPSGNTEDNDSSSEQHKKSSHHHHPHIPHHHPSKSVKDTSVSRATTVSNPDAPASTSSHHQSTIKGPVRLLRLLPRETRHIIGSMLELDPRKRATMEDILKDPWVQNSLVCCQEENGVIFKAPNHTHVLQPSGGGS